MRYFLLCLAAIAAAGCAQDSGLPTPSGKGIIRAINAIPATPPVTFRIEERALDTLSYKSISTPARYDDFEYHFNFDTSLLPGDDATRIATLPLKIDADRDYTLILDGTLDDAEVLVWEQDAREWSDNDTVFALRFGHLSDSLGALDAYLVEEGGTAGADNLLGTVAYGDILPTVDRTEGKHKLVLTTSGDPTDIVYLAPEITYTAQTDYLLAVMDGDEVDTGPYSVRFATTTGTGGPQPDTRYGPTLRLYHAATSMPTADVYDDEALTSLLYQGLAFGSVSPDLPINAGNTGLTYTAAGNPGAMLLETTATASTGTHNNLVVLDDATDGTPEGFDYVPDRRPVSTYAKLSVFHAATNHETVNIYVAPAGDEPGLLVPRFGIQYGGASSQFGQAAGSYDLYATPIDSLTPLAGPTRLDLAAGDVVEVMLLDTVDPDSAVFNIVPPP